jgi:hypothetical protein
MESLSPSTINVRLSAVRKMIGEARKNGMLGTEGFGANSEPARIEWLLERTTNGLEQAKEREGTVFGSTF